MKKVLLFDIETSPNIGYCWGKYEQDIIKFVEERTVICFAYKWLDKKTVKAHSLRDMTPRQLAVKLHSLFDDADVIVGHNGDAFDIKMSNSFFLLHGLAPNSPYKTADTLKIARSKFKFNSNKLNDLGQFLGLGKKVETGGFQLWLDCMANKTRGWNKMIKYNKQDVVLLEEVYIKLRSWATTTPNLVEKRGNICPTCGSNKVHHRGWNLTQTYKKQRLQCRECGRWFAGKKINHPKDKKK